MMMIRNLAARLAIATITIGAATLSASAGVGKGPMGWSIHGQRPHAQVRGSAELTPHERIHLRALLGERYDRLSPVERARVMTKMRQQVAELTPNQRVRLRANAYGHVAGLTPRERERRFRQGLYFGRR